MGFNKQKNSKEIAISVTHPWHPGAQFVFHFPKALPQSALDAEAKFLGLKDAERPEEYRKHLIDTVAEMVTQEPEGFDDFPGASERDELEALRDAESAPGAKPDSRRATGISVLEATLDRIREKPLQARMREYFDDQSQPELESIIVSAWRAYRAAAMPAAYLKSGKDRRPQGHLSSSQAG